MQRHTTSYLENKRIGAFSVDQVIERQRQYCSEILGACVRLTLKHLFFVADLNAGLIFSWYTSVHQ